MKIKAVKCTVKLSRVMCRETGGHGNGVNKALLIKIHRLFNADPPKGRLMEDYMTQPFKIPKYQQYINFPKIKEPRQTSRWQKANMHHVP